MFSTPSIAVIIEPTASKVASLLPGDTTVSPSKKVNPSFGKVFSIASIYLDECVCFIISLLKSAGLFQINFLFFFNVSTIDVILEILSGCPDPVLWFNEDFDVTIAVLI